MNKSLPLMLFFCFAIMQSKASSVNEPTDSVTKNLPIDEIVVTGTRNQTDIRHLPMTVSVINRKKIEFRNDPSLLPILSEQIPGLFITSRGIMGYGVSTGAAGGISLRGIGGGAAAQMLILIDGHPQYMGLFGHPIADAYQSMMAERVEVLRGPASVLYGSNAMGGVINIVTRQQEHDGNTTDIRIGGGSYGTVETEVSNKFREKRFESIVSGSYNRTDGHRENMGFEQYGGYAKLIFSPTDQWKLRGDVNLTHFNASNPGLITNPIHDNDSHITRGMASFAAENHYDKTSGSLSLYYNWGRHKINDGYYNNQSPKDYLFRSKDYMAGISWFQSAELFTGNRLTAGIDYMHFGGKSWNEIILTGEHEPGTDRHINEIAGYIDFRQNIKDLMTLDIGIRVDHHSQTGTEAIPQGGISFQLPKQAKLKAMISKGYRNPTIRELYMFPPANDGLRPERLMNYEISFTQGRMNNRLKYGINVFYIDGDNIIQTVPVNGKMMNVNTGKIENWGTEGELACQITKNWQISTNYSWLNMERPVIGSPEHKLFAGADFSKGKWAFSAGLQYIKGLYTSVEEGNMRTEDFVLLNIRGNYRLCKFASLYIKGENLLAQRYEINLGYPMPKATFMGGIHVHF